MTTLERKRCLSDALNSLRGFIGHQQLSAIAEAMKGEEAQWYWIKLMELSLLVQTMPTTGGTDGQGDQAVAQLRYFSGGQAEWLITEKDVGCLEDSPEQFQSQAFGRANLFGDGGELGYISIREIIENGGELDLHFTPATLAECIKS